MTGAVWFLAGLLGGAAYFALLRWNTMLYVRPVFAQALGVQLLRLAGMGVLLGFAAHHGAWPLLLAALGMLVARPLALRMMQVTP